MNISEKATGFLYLSASTESEWDDCDFVIVEITHDWLALLRERAELLSPFRDRIDLYAHEYWDVPAGYFVHDDEPAPGMQELKESVGWGFVDTSLAELAALTKPQSALSCHTLVMTKDGGAYFTALGKHTDERYSTGSFTVAELLARFDAALPDKEKNNGH